MSIPRVAVFLSHPIQYFSPLWRALQVRGHVQPHVFYYSAASLKPAFDQEFQQDVAWDVDLTSGYAHEFLGDSFSLGARDGRQLHHLNTGALRALARGWDAVYLHGYAHGTNLMLLAECTRRRLPAMCFGDSQSKGNAHKSQARLRAKDLFLRRIVVPRVSAFLGASGATLEYWQSFGAPADRVFLMPCSVDETRFAWRSAEARAERAAALKAQLKIPENAKVVLFCGKLIARKRPQDVLALAAKLRTKGVHAVLIGSGELEHQLKAEAGDNVHFLGFVNQAAMPDILGGGDVLLLPSDYEPYGVVAAEAAAMGTPSIVTDVCGCHGSGSIIQEGTSGLVVPVGNLPALIAATFQIIGTPETQAAFTHGALQLAKTQFANIAAQGFEAATARSKMDWVASLV